MLEKYGKKQSKIDEDFPMVGYESKIEMGVDSLNEYLTIKKSGTLNLYSC